MRKNREASPPQSPLETLCRILRYCNYIQAQIEKFGNDFEEFAENEPYRDTCCLKLSYIGDIIKFLPKPLKEQYDAEFWDALENSRDLIAHEYLVIEHEDVWFTITNDIPKLKQICEKAIGEMFKEIPDEKN